MNAQTGIELELADRPSREKLVVIGNGMAGCRAVEELLARDTERFEATMPPGISTMPSL
jgi:nitrite reductase (NADH) large subunit